MLMKIAALMKGKVAAAVLGVVLVGGGGGAVAVAATQGHLSGLGLQMASSHSKQNDSTETPGANPKDGSHTEGKLTACDATASTVGVTDEKGTVFTFTVTSSTKFNGDIHGNDKGGSTSASNPTFGLTDLCALVNKVKVQVQATASTSGSTTTYNADKITVEGQGTGNGEGERQAREHRDSRGGAEIRRDCVESDCYVLHPDVQEWCTVHRKRLREDGNRRQAGRTTPRSWLRARSLARPSPLGVWKRSRAAAAMAAAAMAAAAAAALAAITR